MPAIAHEETRQQTTDDEHSLKLKVKRSGKQQYEPRLETKKYRRASRREKHQNLQDMYGDRSVEEIYEELED